MEQQPPRGPNPAGNQGQNVPPPGANPNNPAYAPRPPQPPMAGQAPMPGMVMPPPVHNHTPISNEVEQNENRRTLLYGLMLVVAILVVGLIAGVLDSVIRNRDNAFLLNAEDILQVLASIAPWAVIFFLLCGAWVVVANRLFVRWNTSLHDENEEAYGKGIIYEIVHDNNAAAAIILIMPTISIALALIFVAILNK